MSDKKVPVKAAGENRVPTIVFVRTLNANQSAIKESKNAKGDVVRASHPGEFTEEWHKALCPFRNGKVLDPYVWVTPDWVMSQITKGHKPIRVYGLEALPADYPDEWKSQLKRAFAVAVPYVGIAQENSVQAVELEQVKARNAELERVTVEHQQENSNEQQAKRTRT